MGFCQTRRGRRLKAVRNSAAWTTTRPVRPRTRCERTKHSRPKHPSDQPHRKSPWNSRISTGDHVVFTDTVLTVHSRFPNTSELVPAPNSYNLPSIAKYKFKRAPLATITPIRKPDITDDPVPPPNYYKIPKHGKLKCSIKSPSFGQKPSYKQITYIIAEDFYQD